MIAFGRFSQVKRILAALRERVVVDREIERDIEGGKKRESESEPGQLLEQSQQSSESFSFHLLSYSSADARG